MEHKQHPLRGSAKVVAIYRELRLALGDKAAGAEILACAASLVELFSTEDGMPDYDDRVGRQPWCATPVDRALADGGWKTLAREWDGIGWESNDNCGGMRPREWVTA